MMTNHFRTRSLPALLFLLFHACAWAQNNSSSAGQIKTVREEWIHGEMEFLASDALQGRGSATHDELLAATYVASKLREFGIDPAADSGSYIQQGLAPASKGQQAETASNGKRSTWNAVGILVGSDANLRQQAIVLSAHLDHLGLGKPVHGDNIYNGADDDASGVIAVLEFARALGSGARPRRTVIFAFFGSEELGGFGNQYFLSHPPVPLGNVVANLEFEMIGRADSAIARDQLWLTGFERSDLGPELAKHGAHLVADPHPRENFFKRSDNYALAKRGIIAHTVSSFGLHADYHQPSDEIARIDFAHMTSAIQSMIEPVQWLVNTEWKPSWLPGGKP